MRADGWAGTVAPSYLKDKYIVSRAVKGDAYFPVTTAGDTETGVIKTFETGLQPAAEECAEFLESVGRPVHDGEVLLVLALGDYGEPMGAALFKFTVPQGPLVERVSL